MGIPATRFVSELVDDSGLGGWVSTQHDKVLILADSRGLQITPNPTIHCKRIARLILTLGWPVQCRLPIHQRWKVAGWQGLPLRGTFAIGVQ